MQMPTLPGVDLSTLAENLTDFLTPFLPHLSEAGEKIAEEASEKFGAKAWQFAKTVWDKLHPSITKKPAAREAVQDASTMPDDADAQAALRLQLKKLLTADEVLASELSRLWADAEKGGATVIASGDRSVAVGGNVSGSNIITGSRNRIGQK